MYSLNSLDPLSIIETIQIKVREKGSWTLTHYQSSPDFMYRVEYNKINQGEASENSR